ncbi:heavy metal translocating P-type ATPase [Methylocaldum szegediense]|nr:heavy metal translocating P-type ATPase [Methylocaldum szegediense]
MKTQTEGFRIIHELPDRIRLRLARLAQPYFAVPEFEAQIADLDGVRTVRTNRPARSLVVTYDGRAEVRASLLQWLAALPPNAFLNRCDPEPSSRPNRAPLIVSSLALLLLPLLPAPLKAAVTLASISPTVIKGIRTLLSRGVKMEVLDALAVSIAAAQGGFFTANATHLLIQTGGYLEARAERQAHGLLKRLLKRPPEQAWVERDGELRRVDASEIRENEHVVVGPGDSVPVDGRVEHGSALLDQSALTGESVPVRKEQGEEVLAGGLVTEGRLVLRAIRVGEDTAAAALGRYIEESLRRPSDTQRLAEQLGDRLVYLTFALGGLILALTLDPRRVASVFLIDYSCAIKLGTPLAFISGMHDAAEAGILFRGAQALENLAGADTVVFDKTGTLTHSRLEITDVVPLRSDRSAEQLLALAASLEEHTRHPYAEALVKYAEHRGYRHVDHGAVEFVIAHGLNTVVNGRKIFVGSRHYLEKHVGISFASHEQALSDRFAEGKTLLYVAEDKTLIGYVALRDQVREDAAGVLARLKTLGIDQRIMLTGDARHRAEALAAELGIDQLYAEQSPDDKLRIVETLKAAGGKVVFVGDGVNDAPALVSAHIGIAMPRGALLSREAADVILLRDDLEGLVQARELAVRTLDLIHSNFRLDVVVNSLLLVAATFGWLPPIAAGMLHNGTTLAILTRSLKQRAIPGTLGRSGSFTAHPDLGNETEPTV